MEQYIKWGRSGGPDFTGEEIGSISDTSEVLLCGEEATYRFIEDALKALRGAYKTDKIHIGMDEAGEIGRGSYLSKNGYIDSYTIMREHLDKVVELCGKYGFKPMMWSDMFFRLGTQGSYYKSDFGFPKGTKEKIPEAVQLVYWDYYHNRVEEYDAMIKKHMEIEDNLAFAGGIGTWFGFLVSHDYSYDNSLAAMKACVKNGIKTVIATTWGDDGNETNAFLALSLLPIFSEYCYRGSDCYEEDIKEVSEFLTKIKFDDARDMGNLSFMKEVEYLKEWHLQNGGGTDMLIGRRLFYGDILYDMSVNKESCDDIIENYEGCAEKMLKLYKEKPEDENTIFYKYAYLLYKICSMKAELVKNLRMAYRQGNIAYLKKVYIEFLPQLKEWYREFVDVYKAIWKRDYKPFGYEVSSFRFGGVISRINDAEETIGDYLRNNISKIDELEEEILTNEESFWDSVSGLATPTGRL